MTNHEQLLIDGNPDQKLDAKRAARSKMVSPMHGMKKSNENNLK